MKRFGTMWLGGAALVMATGACGSVASTPLGATAVPAVADVAGQAASALVPAPPPEQLIQIRGEVQLVRDPDLEVAGWLVHTGPNTVIIDRDDKPVPLDHLRVGQLVRVEALMQRDGSVFARMIAIVAGEDDPTTGPLTNTLPRR
jgi:hypothetical protein